MFEREEEEEEEKRGEQKEVMVKWEHRQRGGEKNRGRQGNRREKVFSQKYSPHTAPQSDSESRQSRQTGQLERNFLPPL